MTDVIPSEAAGTEPTPPAASGRGGRGRLGVAIAVLAVVAIGVVTALWLVAQFRPHLYAGTVLQGDEPAPSLAELTYADGSPVDVTAFEGDVVLVFFGYTNCPDICPTTLADVSGARERLGGDDAERVHLIMVSVDPDRDDAGSLQDYVGFFDPSFRGAAGEVAAIDRAASAYGVFYRLGEPEADGGYLVDHTGTLMGIGPDGAVRVVWPSGVGSEALAADLDALLP